jgi:hypothetical protein
MGHFYTNVTLKGPDQESVARELARQKRVAAVTKTFGDLCVVYDRESEKQDGSAYPFVSELSKTLNCIALYVTNHDDSVLWYRLFQSGDVLDNYVSSPNYFEGPPAPPSGGDAKLLCSMFKNKSAIKRVEAILRYDSSSPKPGSRYVFEIDRHRDLVSALGLPMVAVGFGYVYLAQDEWPKGLTADDILVTDDKEETGN